MRSFMTMVRIRVRMVAAIAAVCIVLVLAGAHSPPARDLARTQALIWLRSQGLHASVDSLSYNLFTLTLHLRGISMTAVGAATPFVTARDVRLDVPWRALIGGVRLDEVAATGLTMTVERQADGSFNLPQSGSGGAPLARLDLGRLRVQHATVRYSDPASRLHVEAGDLTLDLAPRDGRLAGRVTAGRGLRVLTGDLTVNGTLGGELAYDGVDLTLNGLGYESRLGRLRLDGRVGLFGPAPAMALDVEGGVTLDEVSGAFALDPAVTGSVALAGRVDGPLGGPVAAIDLRSDQVRRQALIGQHLKAHVVMSPDRLSVESAALQAGSGTVEAQGQLTFATLQVTADAAWRHITVSTLADLGIPALNASRLSGHARAEAAFAGAKPALTLDASLRADTPRAGPVQGTVTMTASGPEWRARSTVTLAGATAQVAIGGRIPETGLTGSTLHGSIAASSGDLPGLARTARRLGLWGAEWPLPEAGRARTALQLGGTLTSPTARGTLDLSDGRVAGVGPFTVQTQAAVEGDQVRADGIEGSLGGNRVTGAVSVSRSGGELSGGVDLVLPDFAAFGDRLAGWQPAGRLNAHVDLAGTTALPAAEVTLSGSGLAAGGQALGELSAAATASTSAIALTRGELRQASGGRLTATGAYALAGGRHALTLRADAVQIAMDPALDGSSRLSAVVDGSLDLGGTREHPEGGGRLRVTSLAWNSAHLEQLTADVQLSDTGATVQLDAPALALTAKAVVAQFEPYATTVTAEAAGTNVAELVSRLGPMVPVQLQKLSGAFRARVTAAGVPTALSDFTGDANIDALDLRLDGAALRLAQPASVVYAADSLQVQTFRVQTGATTFDIGGGLGTAFPAGLTLAAAGTLADLRPWLVAAGDSASPGFEGALQVTAQAAGSLERPVLSGEARLTGGHITWPGYPQVTGATATITLRDGLLDVPVVQGHWQDSALDGRARVPLRFLDAWLPERVIPPGDAASAVASLHLRLDNVTPAVLEPFVDAATAASVTGHAAVELDLAADRPALDRITGTLVVPSLSLTAKGLPLEQARPTRVEIASGTLRAADWQWTLAGSPVTVTGTAGLQPGDALDLQVNGSLDMRILSLFLPDGATEGTGELSMAVRGTLDSPVADGTIRLRDGELSLTEPRMGLSGAAGIVVFRPGRIEIDRMDGTLNGGRVSVRGRVDYRDLRVTTGSIVVDATHVALEVPAGVRTEVSAALTLALADRAQLSGRVEVLQGAYREPISLAAAIAATAREREAAVIGEGTGSLLDQIDLNVALTSAEDLAVDNNYGRLDLGLDLRLVGTASAPSVVGRAAIREGGVLFLGGRTYLIDRGAIDFSNPRAIVPQLDLSGRTRVDGVNAAGSPTTYDITLVVTGTPETLTTDLTSTPDLSQADIVSLLATGRLADQIGGAGVAIARDQFIGYLSGETLGFAARAIGMDSIRFERGAGQDALASDASIAGEVNPAQRLTVTRRVAGRAEVSVSQNLRDTGRLTWIAAVTPKRAVELRAVSRDDTSRAYEVRHDISFGGPLPAPAAPRQAGSTVRVSTVRVTGEPGVPVSDAARQLRLKAGSRFDFYRWQQDRDRLRRFYLDRGYREVRISARQVPEPGLDGIPGVALEYRVVAGARAVIEVAGDRLPAHVLKEVEGIWNDALLDIGLISDTTAAVQASLAAEGYLRARVRVARIPPDAGSPLTRLRIRVARGPRSPARSVEATGHRVVSSVEIDAAAAALGLGAWLKPRTLANEITRLYRQRGYLAASVTAGPVTYSPAGAVLPVRIQEGPPFAFGHVSVGGAQARTEAAVRRDLGIAAGTPYTPEALQRARQALIKAYAIDGFNAATVETRSTADAASAVVDVGITIQEGAQQVVTQVAVTGADGVNPGVVTDALRLTPGTPAHLESLYAGRRRLFQTGLFRRADVEATPIAGTTSRSGIEHVRADVTLVRVQPWRLRYGVNVTDAQAPVADQGRTFGGGLSAMLERQGLFGRPGSSVASVRYNNDQRVVRGTVTWPTLFGRAIMSRLYVSNSRDSVSGDNILSFITNRTTFTAEQRLTLWGKAQVAYAYQFERNHVFDPAAHADDPFALNERWRQARLSSSLVLDTRVDPIDPARGLLHSSTVEYGLEALGRNGRFVKYTLQQLAFVPLASGVVSASAVRVSLGKGFGQDLILSERFLAGGTNTVRGYADDSLGGFDFFGDPIPGQATIVLNQEVRFPLARWIRGAAFIDAGDVFERATALSLRSLKAGVGAGLRLQTPIGLFRVDVATPLPRNNRPVRYYLAFGHIF